MGRGACGARPERGWERHGRLPRGRLGEAAAAINAHQAHGRVGSIVFPFAVARWAGLRPGTEGYEEALWGLVWEGALAVDGCVPLKAAARLPFGRAPYRLAPAAIRLLEMA